MQRCRNCQRGSVSRPRGLCWTCYYRPGVREQYPSTSKFGRRGVGNFCGQGAAPHLPTSALPGTPDKVAVLEDRASKRQELWHPQDATADRPAPAVMKAG